MMDTPSRELAEVIVELRRQDGWRSFGVFYGRKVEVFTALRQNSFFIK